MSNKIITISREYASGGHTIGEKLAEKLDIPFYDSNIVKRTMEITGLPEDVIKNAEERVNGSFLFNVVMGVDSTHNYLKQIQEAEQQVISEEILKGPCVLVGRCANIIIKKKVPSLNAFIYSPKKDRILYAQEQYGVPPEEAEKKIQKSDKERSMYSRNFYNQEWAARQHYDIMLNAAALGIDSCVNILAEIWKHE